MSLLLKDSVFAALRLRIEEALAARSAAAGAGEQAQLPPSVAEPSGAPAGRDCDAAAGGGERDGQQRAQGECSTSGGGGGGSPFTVHVCSEKVLSQVRFCCALRDLLLRAVCRNAAPHKTRTSTRVARHEAGGMAY